MKHLHIFIFPLSSFLIISFIFTIFNIINIVIPTFFYLLATNTIVFIYSLKECSKIYNNKIIYGLKIGLVFISIFLILSLLLGAKFTIYSFIFYIILLLFAILGAVLSKILAIYEKK